ncbi:MAG TPA: hypothetical protein VNI20_03150, partial [Fimbriimonadaceae bacterium]|nr:hypothetical protein [Fimbriimonadaceae bacterium]
MRSLVSVFLATTIVSAAMAQSFTIVRPTDGSTVRENVGIHIPKGAIPDRAYIGVSVNGKFLEAARPPLVKDDYVYTLDTKDRHIPDGDMDIEVVLYQDFNDHAEIVNRSSVKVKLDNYTSIKVPDGGVEMRYAFQKGREYHYTVNRYQSIGTLTQAQIAIGSKAGEIPVDSNTSRLLWAIDNVYDGTRGKEALLRIQGLPNKGTNYAMLRTAEDPSLKKYYDFEMHPLYMRIDGTGREIFGAAPPYFPMDNTSGEDSRLDLFTFLPMPVLPSDPLLPGDTWQASQLFSNIDLNKLPETNKLTEALASRGTFVGVEWEKGIPCAKFTVAVDAGPRELTNAMNLNNQPGQSQRVSLLGTMWFALDRGVIVKSDITLLQESVVTIGTPQSSNGSGS